MNITDISGIREATAQRMASHGIDSVEAVAHASIERLVAIPGIGAIRAAALRAAANRLLPEATDGWGVADSEQLVATTGAEDSNASAEIAGDPVEPDTPSGRVTRDRKGKKGKKDRKKRKAEKKRKKEKKQEKRRKKAKKQEKKQKQEKKRKQEKKQKKAKKRQERGKGRRKSKKGGK